MEIKETGRFQVTAKTTLTIMVHGESKVGKSRLVDTMPAPKLILDAEGRAKYLPSGPKVYWDPMTQEPPVVDGTWETCVALVPNIQVMTQAFMWLRSGKHGFVSVGIDSLMEVQKRYIDEIAGSEQLTQPDWGTLLRRLEKLVRDYRDLVLLESNHVQVVVFTVGTGERDGKYRPLLQGAMRTELPYYLDVVGYLYTQQDADGNTARNLLVRPDPQYVAGDGTDAFPPIIANPSITDMFNVLKAHQEKTAVQ